MSGLVLLASVVGAPAGSCATFAVTSTEDATDANPGDGICASLSGACTLRAAVQENNASEGGSSILVPPGTYLLTIAGAGEDDSLSGDLDVKSSVVIIGSGTASTIIDAGGLDNVIEVISGTSGDVVLAGVTLTNGAWGIFHSGTPLLRLQNVIVRDNSAGGVLSGCCNGLLISDSTVADNGGPGIVHYVMSGTIVERSTIRGNVGGGIVGGEGTLIEDCLIEGNSTPGDGGGVHSPQTLYIVRSRIVGNTAGRSGGGVFDSVRPSTLSAQSTPFSSQVTIVDSVIDGNHAGLDGGGVASHRGVNLLRTRVEGNTTGRDGGGVLAGAGPGFGLRLTDSSITNNEAGRDGGGVRAFPNGAGWGINLTVSGNRASRNGGGMHVTGAYVHLANATIAANTVDVDGDGTGDGGGVFVDPFGVLRATNTIIAGNVDAGGESPDCAGVLTSAGYNLLERVQGCAFEGTTIGDLVGVPPGIDRLDDNGGGTLTHRLASTSPAVDAGDPSGCADPAGSPIVRDQRGVERPKGARCDIGAYEFTCGDGVIDLREHCDDGNTLGGDCCSSECEFEPPGSLCTADGEPCTADICDGAGRCTHEFAVNAGCSAARPRGASVVLKRDADPARSRLVWKWQGAGAVTRTDFGVPVVGTDLTLCVGDATGNVLLSATAPAGGTCLNAPCWREVGTGFTYKDRDLSPHGLQALTLRASPAGVGRIVAKAKGLNLRLPPLPLSMPVVVRLLRHDGPSCWDTTFATSQQNDSQQLRARLD